MFPESAGVLRCSLADEDESRSDRRKAGPRSVQLDRIRATEGAPELA